MLTLSDFLAGCMVPSTASLQVAPASVYKSPTMRVVVVCPVSVRVGGAVSDVVSGDGDVTSIIHASQSPLYLVEALP